MLMVFQIFPDLILMMLLSVLLVRKPTFVRIVCQNKVCPRWSLFHTTRACSWILVSLEEYPMTNKGR